VLAAVAVFLVGYAALSHYAASTPNAKGLGAALSIGPVVLIAIALLWRWTRPLTAVLATAAIGGILYRFWAPIERNYQWTDPAEQCGIYALVAVSFAHSLYGDRVPLCTQLAIKMHGELAPAEIMYLRRATAAWAAFYAAIAVAILVLFFSSSEKVWSLFVNFATFGLIVLMGVADHALRRRVLPRHNDGGILGVLRRSLIG
jgi:uncharacterized membrane protein